MPPIQPTAFEAAYFEFDRPDEETRPMLCFALYGKGGIGKSTTSANVALALAEMGLKVMLVGCDPKADSTKLLRGGAQVETVLDLLRTHHRSELPLERMITKGVGGVLLVEAGGPRPGVGCAGRGIIAAFISSSSAILRAEANPFIFAYESTESAFAKRISYCRSGQAMRVMPRLPRSSLSPSS